MRVAEHVGEHLRALVALERNSPLLAEWGEQLAGRLTNGGKLLVAGNGGSAAEAQHLTAELVGRYRLDRPAFSALALHAETSSLTAIANDYGAEEIFARQVRAHGRPGDVLLLLSTSGESENLLRACRAGRSSGLSVWALTGRFPNSLATGADRALSIPSSSPAVVQELHLVALHLLCEAFEAALPAHQEAAS